uniref:Uncharacterized protein n=1 Tax=Lepeophtheirus salmonis TaxID=72036 RepID=A0A0K2UKJ3_LEPSM
MLSCQKSFFRESSFTTIFPNSE